MSVKNDISLNLIIENIIPFLRGVYLQLRALKIVGIILASKGSEIYGLKNLELNGILKLNSYSIFDARYCEGVKIKGRLILGRFSIFRSSGSRNFISKKVFLLGNISFGPYCYIGGGFGLKIKNNCKFGPYCSIHPENHKIARSGSVSKEIYGEGIIIGENCWFGSNVIILDGAIIEGSCVFGASSVVTGKYFKANIVYAGIPARKLK